MQEAQQAEIYQIKITLKFIRLPMWRRIQVHRDITLARLHRVLQAAMGWCDSHLHQFIVGTTYYGQPSIDEFSELDLKDERNVRLDQVLSKVEEKMVYQYDFGDDWEHSVVLERILDPEPGVRYPRCIGGERACPPEDCGGGRGYENFLTALRDPNHEEHDEYLEWIGGEFDPEKFNIDDINTALRRVS